MISDETLMAYADGELSAGQRIEIETAMARDPEVARRVSEHQALRVELGAAFDGVLCEDIPDRLIAAARLAPIAAERDSLHPEQSRSSTRSLAQPAAPLSSSEEGNADRLADVVPLRQRNSAVPAAPQRSWAWPEWTAIAATLVLGVIAGSSWRTQGSMLTADSEGLVATGALARALSEQFAATQSADAPVQVGLSFRDKSGAYCRSFATHAGTAVTGVACRHESEWRLPVLAEGAARSAGSESYRMAATSLPPAVLKSMDERIEGEPLSAQEEQAARKRGWQAN